MIVADGPRKAAMIARATHASGGLINSEDAKNAFNTLERGALLEATHRHWPEAGRVFNTFYGHSSIVVYVIFNDDGSVTVTTRWCSNGTRMGCVLGSLGFNISLHDVYTKLADDFPEYLLRAMTDDAPACISAPTDGDWQRVYRRAAAFVAAYDRLANPIGIFRHPSKGVFLLPADTPWPTDAAALEILRPSASGFVIAGAPVGTDAFVREHARVQVDRLIARIDRILALVDANQQQIAMRLLSTSICVAMNYYVSLVPLHLIIDQVRRFDVAVGEARLQILSLPGSPYTPCSAGRAMRAEILAFLPYRWGGLQQMPVALTGDASFLAALSSCASDPVFLRLRAALQPDATLAHAGVCAAVGLAALPADHPLARVLPVDPSLLTSVQSPCFPLSKHSKQGTFGRISSLVADHYRALLRNMAAEGDGMSESDRIHMLIITSRSQASRVLTASLFYSHNRLAGRSFVDYM